MIDVSLMKKAGN